jgi:hypothetical protein
VGDGPVVAVTAANLWINGSPTTIDELARVLRTLRARSALNTLPGSASGVLLACPAEAPAERLAAVVSAALEAGYERTTFVFLETRQTNRPIYGLITRDISTGAVANIKDGPADGTLIEVRSAGTCAKLSKRLVDERLVGHVVSLAARRR